MNHDDTDVATLDTTAMLAKSCAHWLSWRIGLDLPAARERVRAARALGDLPQIDAALARGELSYAKVRAMTRVAHAGNEALLLDMAKGATGAQLSAIVRGVRSVERPAPQGDERRNVRRRHLPADGMMRIEITLHPDEAARVWQALCETKRALRGEVDATAVAQPSLADAAVALAETQLAALDDAAQVRSGDGAHGDAPPGDTETPLRKGARRRAVAERLQLVHSVL
jgi:hypothetical protein